jgi:hypothetical protein
VITTKQDPGHRAGFAPAAGWFWLALPVIDRANTPIADPAAVHAAAAALLDQPAVRAALLLR